MGYLLKIVLKKIVRRKVNLRGFLVLGRIIKMLNLRGILKLLWWIDCGVYDYPLWLFAFRHGVKLLNQVPNLQSGLTPIEIFTKTKSDHQDLLWSHIWGCSVYVLGPHYIIIVRTLCGIVVQVYDNSLVFQRIVLCLLRAWELFRIVYFTSISRHL